MTDIGRTVAPGLLVAGGQDLDVVLRPPAAYLRALDRGSARWSSACLLFR
jgi:hypothetical protein